MKRTLILWSAAVALAAIAFLGNLTKATASAPNTYVKLQTSTPGTVQP